MIYLAGPFFTPEQLDCIQEVERFIKMKRLDFYSPRSDGVLKDMPPEQRKASLRRIFELNVTNMSRCDTILAVLNWKDTGTIWELGFVYGCNHAAFVQSRDLVSSKRIITFTTFGNEVNVMLKECSDLHCHGWAQLSDALDDIKLKQPFRQQQDNREVF